MALLSFAGLDRHRHRLGIWYHGQVPPNDAGLAIDRYGMVIAFAGTLGLAAAHKVSERAGWCDRMDRAGGRAILGVVVDRSRATIAPYAVLQFGGMALLGVNPVLARRTDDAHAIGPNWGMLIGAYALAKVFEAADGQIWELTSHTLSGHSLKHVAAACVALAVITPLYRRGQRRP